MQEIRREIPNPPSMGHFLSEISKQVDGWSSLTEKQVRVLTDHLQLFAGIIDRRYDTTGLRKNDDEPVGQEVMEKYWDSFRTTEEEIDTSFDIIAAELIVVATIISTLKTQVALHMNESKSQGGSL